jgi:hypothetical protein
MRRFAPALLSLLVGCAAQPPLPQYEEARLHCQALMYYSRGTTGRSAPNWNFYDYCMREQGYGR